MQVPFDKNPLTIDEQIALLKKRGLLFSDENRARLYLEHISYYHFTPYFKAIQDADNKFNTDSDFEDVLQLYMFDKGLRLLLLDVLERIEMSFKCKLVYYLSLSCGSDWLSDAACFASSKRHKEATDDIMNNLKNSKDQYIRDFYIKHGEVDCPPAWMVIESLSFGQCVHIYANLNKANQKRVSKSYEINHFILGKWMRSLSVLRNICAHHSRLWNRSFHREVNKSRGTFSSLFQGVELNSLFAYIIPLMFFLYKMNPESEWLNKLKDLIIFRSVDTNKMGFPNDWKDRLEKFKLR